MKVGINVTWNGTIIETSVAMKIVFFIGNASRDSANAAMDEETSTPKTQSPVIFMLFKRNGTIGTVVGIISSILLFIGLAWLGYAVTKHMAEEAIVQPRIQ